MSESGPVRVLLVDDEETILFSISKYFESRGMTVDGATTVSRAYELIGGCEYDAAIIDLRLTTADDSEGLQVVRALRHAQPHCRVVILTAYGTSQVRSDAAEYEIDAFLSKPKRLPELVQVVSELVAAGSSPVDGPSPAA